MAGWKPEPETPQLAGATGYRHAAYAHSLAEIGAPRHLPASHAWLLQRPIAAVQPAFSDLTPPRVAKDLNLPPLHDAMGLYPLFSCANWSLLPADLDALAPELVSVALVPDPFGDYRLTDLKRWFKDVVTPFKSHYVVNLAGLRSKIVSYHHRRYALKALRHVEVAACPRPLDFHDDWVQLYDYLIARHNIRGLRRFSPRAFAQQLQTPGIVALRAVHRDETVAMLLWYVMGDVAHYHLGASNQVGYHLHAAFALFWESIDYFASGRAAPGVRWLNLGSCAGLDNGQDDGLSRFKRGWATGTRTAYFCGRILQPARYEQLAHASGHSTSGYFPTYRYGEYE